MGIYNAVIWVMGYRTMDLMFAGFSRAVIRLSIA